MFLIKPLVFFLFFLSFLGAKKDPKKDFKLPPAIGGGQTGWLDVERLPTSIKINDEWVLPRGGTMEWLMSKGYVPDSDNANVMKPNPFDKRYKEPRHRYLPPLATTPIDYIYVPKPKRSNDPFAGIADPIEKSFSPLPDIGIDDAVNAPKNQVGPLLNPDLPDLKNSPFAEPEQLPVAKNPKVDPFKNETKPKLPANDPFADEVLNQNNPKTKPNQLPGKNIPILPRDQRLPGIKPNA